MIELSTRKNYENNSANNECSPENDDDHKYVTPFTKKHFPEPQTNVLTPWSVLKRIKNQYKIDSTHLLLNMIRKQNINRSYNDCAFHLEVRSSLLEWINSLVTRLSYCNTTYHLSVAIMDFVFSNYEICHKDIKLVCFISVHLAAKLHESDKKLLSIQEIFHFFKSEFTVKEICNCERIIFKALECSIDLQTPLEFLMYFLCRGMLNSEIVTTNHFSNRLEQNIERFEKLATTYIDLCLLDYELYQFSAMTVATGALIVAKMRLNMSDIHTDRLRAFPGFNQDETEECVERIIQIGKFYGGNLIVDILKEKSYNSFEPFTEKSNNFSFEATAQNSKLKNRKNSEEFQEWTHNLRGDQELEKENNIGNMIIVNEFDRLLTK